MTRPGAKLCRAFPLELELPHITATNTPLSSSILGTFLAVKEDFSKDKVDAQLDIPSFLKRKFPMESRAKFCFSYFITPPLFGFSPFSPFQK
jgi:hypothetical protein